MTNAWVKPEISKIEFSAQMTCSCSCQGGAGAGAGISKV